MTLLWRVFGTNAAILVLATLVLVLSPVTVSFPIALAELIALSGGLAAMLFLNLVLLRRAFRPLGRLTSVMRGIDPLRPGERATLDAADPEVAELTAAFKECSTASSWSGARARAGRSPPRKVSGAGSRVSSTTRSGRR
jgi:two-component system, NarL family, sensor histidine kinase UhpB